MLARLALAMGAGVPASALLEPLGPWAPGPKVCLAADAGTTESSGFLDSRALETTGCFVGRGVG